MNKLTLGTFLILCSGTILADCSNFAGVYKNMSCEFSNPSSYTADDLSVTLEGAAGSSEGIQLIQNAEEIGLSDLSQIPGRYTPHNTIFLADKDLSGNNMELKMLDVGCENDRLNVSYQVKESYGSSINDVTTRYQVELEKVDAETVELSVKSRLRLLFTAGIFVEGSSAKCVLKK